LDNRRVAGASPVMRHGGSQAPPQIKILEENKMTKSELVAFIMENTTEYKKTHLVEKYKDELETIAATFRTTEIIETGTDCEPSDNADKLPTVFHAPEIFENGTEGELSDDAVDSSPATDGEPPADEPQGDIEEMIAEAYEDNKKMVKMRLLDRNEFRETVIEKTLERVAAEGLTSAKDIVEQTISTLREFMENLTAFCPMKDSERIIFETIPLMEGYENEQSQISGKMLLQKVKELHKIEPRTASALLVSLKRKKFIAIEGGKKSYVVLLERGIKHLHKVS